MSPAAQLAKLLAERFVTSAPPDLTLLCKQLGLRIQEVPANGFDGALIRSKAGQKGIIAIKESIREPARKRFTIAHEIGHFVLPHHRTLKNVCEEKKIDTFDAHLNRPEVEANEFAAELLLPTAVLAKRFDLTEYSLAAIATVAAEFQTSLSATIRSFLRLTPLPCAMIWSTDNHARWCARSDSFQFFLPLNELPADESYAAKIFNGGNAPATFTPVPANAWLDRQAAARVPTLLEHSLALPNYRAVLTLLWAYNTTPTTSSTDEESLLDELDPQDFTIQRRTWPR